MSCPGLGRIVPEIDAQPRAKPPDSEQSLEELVETSKQPRFMCTRCFADFSYNFGRTLQGLQAAAADN
jgi:hypothetical protein